MGDKTEREHRVEINQRFEGVHSFIGQFATNISRTGVFIRTDEPLPIGTLVKLKFTVVTHEIEQIEGSGAVVRVSDDPPGMGIVFAYLSPDSEAFIDRLIASGAAGDPVDP